MEKKQKIKIGDKGFVLLLCEWDMTGRPLKDFTYNVYEVEVTDLVISKKDESLLEAKVKIIGVAKPSFHSGSSAINAGDFFVNRKEADLYCLLKNLQKKVVEIEDKVDWESRKNANKKRWWN